MPHTSNLRVEGSILAHGFLGVCHGWGRGHGRQEAKKKKWYNIKLKILYTGKEAINRIKRPFQRMGEIRCKHT